MSERRNRHAREVRGVELDETLCHELRRRFGRAPGVSIVRADFLQYRLPRDREYKVVGNIPFNRTAAIIERAVGATPAPEDVYLVVQTGRRSGSRAGRLHRNPSSHSP